MLGADVFAWGIELVEELVEIAGESICLLRPADPAALLDEDSFAEDEFLPYWAELWPSSWSLVQALPDSLEDRRVLELGCGLGLPSIVAARRGAKVLATDWAADALALLACNATRNGVELSRARLDWTAPDETTARGPFDLVLAADVAYENRNVAPLAALLERLGTEVLLADPGRAACAALLERLVASFDHHDLGAGVHRLVPLGR
jgi:predicted nicotinamide N-methyase